MLDQKWKEWTGITDLLSSLDKYYIIKRVHCWKSFNEKPDMFKYSILVEIGGDEDDLWARDILQKFRMRRMSGYVALYRAWQENEIERAMVSSESLGAMIYNLVDDDDDVGVGN